MESKTIEFTYYLSPFDKNGYTENFKDESDLTDYLQENTFYCEKCNRDILLDDGRLRYYRIINDEFICLDCLQKELLEKGISANSIGDIIEKANDKSIIINDIVYKPKNKMPSEIMFYNESDLLKHGYEKYDTYFCPLRK